MVVAPAGNNKGDCWCLPATLPGVLAVGMLKDNGKPANYITGQLPIRTGMTKVGLPGVPLGLEPEDPTLAELLKPLGYTSGQFGKNHLGDLNRFLPTAHGFDEFYGNLYHLNRPLQK